MTVELDPLGEEEGAAYLPAVRPFLEQPAAWLAAIPGLGPDARRGLLSWLARRLLAPALSVLARGLGWPEILSFFPVVARLQRQALATWSAACLRLVAHAHADHPRAGEIVGLTCFSDFLAGRRTTSLVAFADGTRLVHRELDLGAAAWFMDLIRALNQAGLSPPLGTRVILALGDHAWDEEIVPGACPPEAFGRFFTRVGMLLRLLEATRAIDMHWRNLMMDGEDLQVIDLEGILANHGPSSPQTTGLLPSWLYGEPGRAPANLGGLHEGGTVQLPVPVPRFRTQGFTSVFATLRAPPTVPAPPHGHIDAIVGGYRALDELLARPELAAFTQRACTLRTREFVRPGHEYQKLLVASLAPSLLSDEAARDAFLHAHARPDEVKALRDLSFPRIWGPAAAPEFRPHSAEQRAQNEQAIGRSLIKPTGR